MRVHSLKICFYSPPSLWWSNVMKWICTQTSSKLLVCSKLRESNAINETAKRTFYQIQSLFAHVVALICVSKRRSMALNRQSSSRHRDYQLRWTSLSLSFYLLLPGARRATVALLASTNDRVSDRQADNEQTNEWRSMNLSQPVYCSHPLLLLLLSFRVEMMRERERESVSLLALDPD